MSEANAEQLTEYEEAHGYTVRTREQLRRDERRDRLKAPRGWYMGMKAGIRPYRKPQGTRLRLWRPEWARIAGPWNVPDYLKVSAAPQESPTS